jgi:hypothetical protein
MYVGGVARQHLLLHSWLLDKKSEPSSRLVDSLIFITKRIHNLCTHRNYDSDGAFWKEKYT